MTHRDDSAGRHPVTDPDAPRRWSATDKAREEVMNLVLGIMLAASAPISQKQIRERLQDQMPETAPGTIQANVSASLLYFATAGWVEHTGAFDGRSPIWQVID